jgi:type I restriction enzyme S subunit
VAVAERRGLEEVRGMEREEYQDTEIGGIPKDWKVVRLGEVAEIRRKKTLSLRDLKEVAVIPMELVPDNGFYADYTLRTLEEIKSFVYCETGDILLAKITPSLENGKQGVVPFGIPNGFAFATTEVFPITPKTINREFLFYILKFSKFRDFIVASMTGTTGRQRASKDAVENLQIPLPPLPEQKKIAEILSAVDRAIEEADKAIEKTEKLKRGLMEKLLTEGIGHTDFQDTEIGRIPKDWKVVRLGEVARVESGFGFPLKYQGKALGKYPFIKVKDLNASPKYINAAENYIDDEDVQSLRVKVFPPKTILFPKIGMTIHLNKFRVLNTWGIVDNNIAGVIPEKKIDPEFLFYYFCAKVDLKQLSGRTTAPSIRKTTLAILPLPLPPLPEQKKIAEILMTVDRKMELLRKKRELLRQVKKGLMEDLLTGRVRVLKLLGKEVEHGAVS